MAKTIKIKKGLTLNLKGKASETSLSISTESQTYALVPDDFIGIIPKPEVRAGDRVLAGQPLFYSKTHPQMKFVSPVSGEVVAIHRGAKRKIESIEVCADGAGESVSFDLSKASTRQGLKELLLGSGMWGFIKQRPYDIVANPDVTPRDIFVTACFTAPLAPSWSYLLSGNEEDFRAGMEALTLLTEGKVFLGVASGCTPMNLKGVEVVEVAGPHPAGNVGVLINHLAPVNKGETVWTLKATDVIVLGRLLRTGKADFSRRVAVTGSEALTTGYVHLIPGAVLNAEAMVRPNSRVRIVAGDPLTGVALSTQRPFVPYNTDQITLLPEGDQINELFGWIRPRLNQHSMSRSYFAWLMPKKEFAPDTRIKGGERAMIMSHELNRVFPMDIYAEQLLKAIIAFDIDRMEQLGIYEVAPEDFAMCEYVDTSKMQLQHIVRMGLNLLYKEMN